MADAGSKVASSAVPIPSSPSPFEEHRPQDREELGTVSFRNPKGKGQTDGSFRNWAASGSMLSRQRYHR